MPAVSPRPRNTPCDFWITFSRDRREGRLKHKQYCKSAILELDVVAKSAPIPFGTTEPVIWRFGLMPSTMFSSLGGIRFVPLGCDLRDA